MENQTENQPEKPTERQNDFAPSRPGSGNCRRRFSEVPLAQINPDSSPQNIENWDSVRHLNLVLALEQDFSLQFEPEEIDQLNNVGEIVTVVSRKLNAGA